jgi:hypothetical protein
MYHPTETRKLWAGNLLEILAPAIRRDLDQDLHSGRFVRLRRCMLYARTARARPAVMRPLYKKACSSAGISWIMLLATAG